VTRSTTSAGGPTSTGAAPSDWAAARTGPPPVVGRRARFEPCDGGWRQGGRSSMTPVTSAGGTAVPKIGGEGVRKCGIGSTIDSLTFRRLSDVGQE